jgi:hypothetical protein
MSLPIGIRHIIGNKQEDIGDQVENFIDFEKGIDWTFGVARHEDKRQTVEGPTLFLVKIPLYKSTTKYETQVAWH